MLVEVRAAARAIDTARRSIAPPRRARELAERNLDAEKKKFDNGMTTSFQVTQIQRDLSVARTGRAAGAGGVPQGSRGVPLRDGRQPRLEGDPDRRTSRRRAAPPAGRHPGGAVSDATVARVACHRTIPIARPARRGLLLAGQDLRGDRAAGRRWLAPLLLWTLRPSRLTAAHRAADGLRGDHARAAGEERARPVAEEPGSSDRARCRRASPDRCCVPGVRSSWSSR